MSAALSVQILMLTLAAGAPAFLAFDLAVRAGGPRIGPLPLDILIAGRILHAGDNGVLFARVLFGAFLLPGVFVFLSGIFPGMFLILQGMLFGALIWLIVNLTVVPLLGLGLFCRSIRITLHSLLNHLLYGVVLGSFWHVFLSE